MTDSPTDTCAVCGYRLDEDGECYSQYAEHLGPVAEEVLTDFVPRYENRPEEGLTLFWVYDRPDTKMNLPVPRPQTIICLYPDNIQGRNNDDCEAVGPEYSIHKWEDWFSANHDTIILPAGTKEFNLSPDELESYRSSSIRNAGLPSDFDLHVAFCEISRVIREDDPEFQHFWKRVLAEYQKRTAEVPPLSSANRAAA